MSRPSAATEDNYQKGSSEQSANPSRTASSSTLDLSQYIGERESESYQVYPGAERDVYDFTAERFGLHCTNLIESTAHLIKGCLGAGILSIHEGYMFAGLWTSLGVTLILGIIVFHTMSILVKSAQYMCVVLRIPKLTYPDLAEVAVATGPWKRLRKYSKFFRYSVDMCLLMEMCGTCCIYQIMIANTLKQVLEAASSNIRDNYNFNLRIYILIITIPLLVLCLIKNLKYLAPFSLLADVLVGICVLTTIYYSLSSVGKITDRPGWKSVSGLIEFSGICLYSIDGIGVILPVENNMKKPKYCYIVMQFGMTIVIISVTVTGFFGYWGWGENCRSPITIHIPMVSEFPMILQFLLVGMLSVNYAVHFWVPFRVVWHYIGKRHKRKRGTWERFYRALHVVLISCLAVAFPHLIKLMIIVGNLFLSFIAFVFPPFIDCMITPMHQQIRGIRWKLIKNASIILLGLTLCGGTLYTFVSE